MTRGRKEAMVFIGEMAGLQGGFFVVVVNTSMPQNHHWVVMMGNGDEEGGRGGCRGGGGGVYSSGHYNYSWGKVGRKYCRASTCKPSKTA
jgi:hypothetical protein